MKRKQTKAPVLKAYAFYLSNGELLAKLTFANDTQVKRLFAGCKIKAGNVYLA